MQLLRLITLAVVVHLVVIVAVKFLVAGAYVRLFRLHERAILVACLAFNVAMVPILLMPFYSPSASPSLEGIWSLGGPAFWAIEGLIYYSLVRVRLWHAAGLAVAVNVAQNVVLSLFFLAAGGSVTL